jgi:hypothetical protein
MELFNPKFDWAGLIGAPQPYVHQVTGEVCQALTGYCRSGIQDASGRIYSPDVYQKARAEQSNRVLQAAMQMVAESGGGMITPDMYPNFFAAADVTLPHETRQPDTSYLDWCVQRKMTLELEDRKEWGYTVEFVRMRRAGQVQYGKFADATAQMTNEEWGAGLEIFRTWFETNQFGIKMAALAPEYRYSYYNNIANIIYNTVIATSWQTLAGASNVLISDINDAIYARRRYEQTWNGEKPFENSSFRLVAPIEFEKYMAAAAAQQYATTGVTEVLQQRIATTYTPKLPFVAAACKVYLIADKWKKNELGTRVPYGIFGQAVDIDTFADKMSFRGAWGFQVDPQSGVELTFDTTAATFFLAPPIPTRVIP